MGFKSARHTFQQVGWVPAIVIGSDDNVRGDVTDSQIAGSAYPGLRAEPQHVDAILEGIHYRAEPVVDVLVHDKHPGGAAIRLRGNGCQKPIELARAADARNEKVYRATRRHTAGDPTEQGCPS